MIKKKRYGQKPTNPFLRWGYIVVFGLIALWLLLSIFMQKSPVELLSTTFSKIPTPVSSALQQEILEKDSIIAELQKKLATFEGRGNFKRGMVIIDSPTLNLRSGPSLTSAIVMKIPANAEVEILFYDTETFYLNSKPGKWCRIRYVGNEGWVWGNFVNQI